MISSKNFCLSARPKVVRVEVNQAPLEGRKSDFAFAQVIKQQTGLKLIGDVRTDKAVDRTLDSNFFHRKSNSRHGRAPKRRHRTEILAVGCVESRDLQRQIQEGEAAPNSRLLVNASARFFLRRIRRRRSTFKATRFVHFGQSFVHGECPRPLAVFYSRENVHHATFVFEPFHLSFRAYSGKSINKQFNNNLFSAPLRSTRTHQYPSEVVSNPQESQFWLRRLVSLYRTAVPELKQKKRDCGSPLRCISPMGCNLRLCNLRPAKNRRFRCVPRYRLFWH